MRRAAGRLSAGCARTSSTSAKSIALPTSRSGRTGRCSGTSCGSGSRCAGRSSGLDVTGDRQPRRRHLGLRLRAARRATAPCSRTRITIATRAPTASWRRSSSGCRADEIYAITGIQFLPFNTLYQLYAACQRDAQADRRRVDRSLTDPRPAELLADRHAGSPSTPTRRPRSSSMRGPATGPRRCSSELGIPTRLLPPVVEAGHRARTAALGRVRGRSTDTPVVAPACHDTGSAVASVAGGRHRAFLSSGTWSLLGTEVPAPIITAAIARAELHQRRRRLRHDAAAQEHRRAVAAAGVPPDLGVRRAVARLRRAAGDGERRSPGVQGRCSIRTIPAFLHPPNMVAAIAEYCRETGQPEPDGPGRLHARDSREPRLQVPVRPRLARRADRPRHRARSRSSAADRATGC